MSGKRAHPGAGKSKPKKERRILVPIKGLKSAYLWEPKDLTRFNASFEDSEDWPTGFDTNVDISTTDLRNIKDECMATASDIASKKKRKFSAGTPKVIYERLRDQRQKISLEYRSQMLLFEMLARIGFNDGFIRSGFRDVQVLKVGDAKKNAEADVYCDFEMIDEPSDETDESEGSRDSQRSFRGVTARVAEADAEGDKEQDDQEECTSRGHRAVTGEAKSQSAATSEAVQENSEAQMFAAALAALETNVKEGFRGTLVHFCLRVLGTDITVHWMAIHSQVIADMREHCVQPKSITVHRCCSYDVLSEDDREKFLRVMVCVREFIKAGHAVIDE
eukprot:TRINITY_DN128_c3_g1_i1.p1 TRINITY_DN128_c3_g1~~TRINITY_DN128_c3_g1_i1.p1  ORF type:complete len:334 (+),score=48.49 TRINITY_DN128_c3_g1_i1:164-1165(+)